MPTVQFEGGPLDAQIKIIPELNPEYAVFYHSFKVVNDNHPEFLKYEAVIHAYHIYKQSQIDPYVYWYAGSRLSPV